MVKSIRFNTDEVRATLDGRKTTKRLVVKCTHKNAAGFNIVRNHVGEIVGVLDYDEDERSFDNYTVPPYKPGDILWVRETWAPLYADDNSTEVVGYLYKADPDCQTMEDYDRKYPAGKDWTWEGRWRPSIHMPREAARIFLRVTDVRVERLQELTAGEAHMEGVDISFSRVSGDEAVGNYVDFSLEKFETLWDSTIKPADRVRYGWAANPFCWVISFERISKDEAMQ